MENLNQTYHTRLQFPAGWFNGLVESILQMFHSCHSFPFMVLLYGQMHGKWAKTGSTRIKGICLSTSRVLCVTGRAADWFLYGFCDRHGTCCSNSQTQPHCRWAGSNWAHTRALCLGWPGGLCSSWVTCVPLHKLWGQQCLPLDLPVEQLERAALQKGNNWEVKFSKCLL